MSAHTEALKQARTLIQSALDANGELTIRAAIDCIRAIDAALPLPDRSAAPVAYLWQHGETGRTRIVMPDQIVTVGPGWAVVGPLVLGAAPQQGEQG